MNNKKLLYSFFTMTLMSSLFVSCSSNEEFVKNDDTKTDFVEKFISANNEQQVCFNISYDVTNGYKVPFKVYSENPYAINSDGTVTISDISPIISGITDENGEYKFTRMIPGGVKEIFVISDCAGVPAIMHGTIVNGTVSVEKYDMEYGIDSRGGSSDCLSLGGWNKLGRPDYIDSNVKCNISNGELKTLSSILTERVKVSDELSKPMGLYVEKSSEIWISIISDKSLFNNSIGYYCYDNSTNKNDVKDIIAFPSTRTYSLLNGLHNGEYIKLKYYDSATGKFSDVFPAGTNIGFVLHKASFNSFNGSLNMSHDSFYTNSPWNPEKSKNKHSAILKTYNGNIIVGLEDINNESSIFADNDCNDVMMHVKSYPEDGICKDIYNASIDNNDIVVEDNSEAVRPLKNIIDSFENDELKDLVVYTKSKFRIVNGYVTGVKDEIFVASTSKICNILRNDYGRVIDYLPTNLFVYNDFILSRIKGKKLLHTTVKEMDVVDKTTRSGSSSEFGVPYEIVENYINQYRQTLKNGGCLNLEMFVEFEPVSYGEFVTTIPMPPYTPFIINE